MASGAGRRDELLEMRGHTEQRRSSSCGCRVATSQFSNSLQQTEPWLSGCPVLSGDLSGCRAAVGQLSGAVNAVGCCRMLSGGRASNAQRQAKEGSGKGRVWDSAQGQGRREAAAPARTSSSSSASACKNRLREASGKADTRWRRRRRAAAQPPAAATASPAAAAPAAGPRARAGSTCEGS